jgi:hypothetical protein
MKLRLYARTQNLVPDPRQRRTQGEPARYVGREWRQAPFGVFTTEQGAEFETDQLLDDQLNQLRKAVVRDRALWCANAETAAFFGVELVALTYNATDAIWTPKPVAAEAADSVVAPTTESGGSKKSARGNA